MRHITTAANPVVSTKEDPQRQFHCQVRRPGNRVDRAEKHDEPGRLTWRHGPQIPAGRQLTSNRVVRRRVDIQVVDLTRGWIVSDEPEGCTVNRQRAQSPRRSSATIELGEKHQEGAREPTRANTSMPGPDRSRDGVRATPCVVGAAQACLHCAGRRHRWCSRSSPMPNVRKSFRGFHSGVVNRSTANVDSPEDLVG